MVLPLDVVRPFFFLFFFTWDMMRWPWSRYPASMSKMPSLMSNNNNTSPAGGEEEVGGEEEEEDDDVDVEPDDAVVVVVVNMSFSSSSTTTSSSLMLSNSSSVSSPYTNPNSSIALSNFPLKSDRAQGSEPGLVSPSPSSASHR